MSEREREREELLELSFEHIASYLTHT